MAKTHSPLLGFNTNVKHKGKVFHIQTEDSGIKHPHIITHLFADGGRILKSTKTSYAEHIGDEDLTEAVRSKMKAQHKAMFIALRDGEYDSLIDDMRGTAEGAPHKAESTSSETAPKPPLVQAPSSASAPAAGSAAASAVGSAPAIAPAPATARQGTGVATAPTIAAQHAVAPTSVPRPPPPRPGRRAPTPPPPTSQREPAQAPQPDSHSPAAIAAAQAWTPSIDVDMDVLNRAAVESERSGVIRSSPDMPPPPPSVLSSKKPVGSYAMTSAESAEHGLRYAASRPASIFANARPTEGGTVFGEDLISDKSLDEVILSFLSEEVSTSSRPDDDNNRGGSKP